MKTFLPVLEVLAIVIFIWGAYSTYLIYHAISISKNVLETIVPFERHPEKPTMKILVVGDSTAVGTGASTSTDSTAGRLGTTYPTADVTNISENGLKLTGLVTILINLDANHYDLILAQIGANDITGLTPLDSIKEELNKVLKFASSHGTDVIILHSGNIGLSPVFKFPVAEFMTYRTLKVRSIYMNAVTAYPNVHYVDLFKNAQDDIFSTDINKYYAADRFHPSSDGYAVWYEAISKYLQKI
jgi:lysophospholipase L1-like esterase